jgi:hypothetical protein
MPRAAALVLALDVVLDPSGAHATRGQDPAQAVARPRVEIVVHGDPQSVESLRVQLEGAVGDGVQLAIAGVDRIDLAVALAPGPGDTTTLARVWIELAPRGVAPTHATIVVVDGARERALVRHIRADQGIDAAVRETIATICATAIEGLRAGAVIGLERAVVAAELAPPADPTPAAVAPPEPPVAIEPAPPARAALAPREPSPRTSPIVVPIELAWAITAWSRAPVIQHGPALGIGVLARGKLQPGGGVTGQFRLPAIVDHDDVRARLDSGAVRVWAGLHPQVAPRLRLRARTGGGVDLLRAVTSSRTTGVEPTAAAVHAIPIVRASLGLQIALPRRLALAFDASVEVDLVNTQFVLQAPERTVLDPWRARPGLAIALMWDPMPSP